MWTSRGWVCGLDASWEETGWEVEQGEGTPSAAAQTSWSPLVAVLRLRLLLATRIPKWPWPCSSSPGLPWCPWSHAHLCPQSCAFYLPVNLTAYLSIKKVSRNGSLGCYALAGGCS